MPADIRVVGNVPLLGSGKTDYVGATKLADVPARTGLAAGEMCKLAP